MRAYGQGADATDALAFLAIFALSALVSHIVWYRYGPRAWWLAFALLVVFALSASCTIPAGWWR